MNALWLAVLLSVAGPETSIPVRDLGDLALVPVRDGYVMAWSDGPRIFTEHLDANLRTTDAPFSFPLVVPSSVTSLAIASNGTSVLVTWQESRASNVNAQYAAILDSGARSTIAGPLFMEVTTQPAAAGVKDGKYRVVVAAQVWTLDEHLGIQGADVLPDGAVVAFSPAGDEGIAKRATSVKCQSGGFGMPWQGCDYDEAITFTAPSGQSGFSYSWRTFMQNFQWVIKGTDPVLRPPLVGPNGNSFVGAVVTTDGTSVCEVRDSGRTWTTATPLLAIAGNGNDVLAIWRDSVGLRAVFLGSEPFTISSDGDIPKIVPAGSDTFVVLFRRGSSIVVRKVSVQAPRGRAVR